jgi:aminoglycoside phosphotransferase (APT) family kinase protein
MESATKNRKTRAQIAQMVDKSFGGLSLAEDQDAVTELTEGWFSAAYTVRLSDGREVILKIAPPEGVEILTYEKHMMPTEVATMRLVRENPAIPVPEVYYFDTERDVCDSEYFFMQKLTGDNYEHIKPSLSPEVRSHIDQQIGVIVRQIHSFTGPYFGYKGNSDLRAATWEETFIKIIDSVLADGLRKNADFGYSPDEIHSAILKHTHALDAVTIPQLVHWDTWNLNFFVKDGHVSGIIDFERALWADPLMESLFCMLTFAGVTESMHGYGKTTFTHAEIERCYLYTLHLALVMNTECYYRKYTSDTTSKRLKELLASTLSWLKDH